jgi:sugar phosphate isomerase/epimerase
VSSGGPPGTNCCRLGIFARIFPRPRAEEVAAAVARAGFGLTQLNLSCIGLPTLPGPEVDVDLSRIGACFSARGVRVWGLSATYNVIHPDLNERAERTAKAVALISRAPQLGVEVVTLCTGTRDGENMWRSHPDNSTEEAWGEMRATLDLLLAAAEEAGVRLGIEPEPGNVVCDASRASRLVGELEGDSGLIGIVLDPANLVTPATVTGQRDILRRAFGALGGHTVALHAKDVVPDGGYAAAGRGQLDYDLVSELYTGLPSRVPVIIQDAVEEDVARTRDFLLSHWAARRTGRAPA